MGRRSRKALSFVLSGLLATSMFTALPGGVARAEELESVPMQSEKRVTENESQMAEDTSLAPQATTQMTEDGAQPAELVTQSDEAAQPTVLVAQNANLPDKFDLRENGVVTRVKIQNPWQSCWAFGSIAAAETSILSMLKEKGKEVNAKDFDLSEKHLVWFGLNTVTEAIDPTQVGEGMLVTGTTANVGKAVYDNGGYGLNASTLFACGVGPVYEKYFPYQGDTGLTERQYLDANPEVKDDVILETCKGLTGGLTPEEVVSRLRNDDPAVIKFLDTLRNMGCLTEPDNNNVTTDVLGQAFLTFYMKKNKDNAYTKRDDWSIPETGNYEGQEVLNRNVTSGFTMVDGNKLPSLSIKNAKGKWISINQEGIDAVKSELAKGRGVSAGFQADQAAPGEDVPEKYMSTKTWAHYTYEDKGTSHMICIVGWDDDYSASNFLEGHQPPADGAWLVKNSWGSETDYVTNDKGADIAKDAWGITNEEEKHTGYFWISYYDKSLNYCESMSFDTDLADADGEMATLMYDYMPSLIGARTGEDTSEQSEGVVKTANVFKNDTGEYTKLASVSTRTAHPKATVKYTVYKLNDGFQNPEDGLPLGTKTATYDYAGFHREKLDGSIVLKPGETFAVVAEETVEEGGKTLHEYAANIAYTKAHAEAVQAREAQEGIDSDNRDRNADEYGIAVVNKGESFIFDNDTWTDWSEYEPRTALLDDYAIDNFSIKAYMVSTTEPKTFSDVKEDDWFYGVSSRAVGLGFLNGYDNGNFGPNDGITRGQVAVTLWHMAGDLEPGENPKTFPDLDAEKYYATAVTWAGTAGVVNGYEGGNFGAEDPVNREQLATMLANYAEKVAKIEVSGSASDYKEMKDAGKVSPWAQSSVGWCFTSGIMSGTEDGNVNPQGGTTRAETAKMVVFLHDLLS